jgi:hypothetical protein
MVRVERCAIANPSGPSDGRRSARRPLRIAMWLSWLSLSASVGSGCGPERESPEEAAQDLLNEVGAACSVACRVDDSCPGHWSYSGECAQECGHTIVDEFAGVAEETPCVSARFDLAYCQGDLTCEQLDALNPRVA